MKNLNLVNEFEKKVKEIQTRGLNENINERDLSYCIGKLIMNAESYPANREVYLSKQIYEEDIIQGVCSFVWNYQTNEFKFVCRGFEFTNINNLILSALITSKGRIINKTANEIVIF